MTTGKMTRITDMGEGQSETIDAVSMADYLDLQRKLKIAEEALEEVLNNSCGYPDDNEDIIEKALSAIREE